MGDYGFMKTINEVYEYHKYNQPQILTDNFYVSGDELETLETLIDTFEKFVYSGKCRLYNVYMTYSKRLFDKLDTYKNFTFNDKTDSQVIRSRARIIKQCSKIIREHYDNMLNIYDKECICKRKMIEGASREVMLHAISSIASYGMAYIDEFMERTKLLVTSRYKSSDGTSFGLLDGIININDYVPHDICVSMRYIIPNTDITVFEFLFMDFDPTHLPILNHEELMVKKFKTLKHLIEERCVILKSICQYNNDDITNQNDEDSQNIGVISTDPEDDRFNF